MKRFTKKDAALLKEHTYEAAITLMCTIADACSGWDKNEHYIGLFMAAVRDLAKGISEKSLVTAREFFSFILEEDEEVKKVIKEEWDFAKKNNGKDIMDFCDFIKDYTESLLMSAVDCIENNNA